MCVHIYIYIYIHIICFTRRVFPTSSWLPSVRSGGEGTPPETLKSLTRNPIR